MRFIFGIFVVAIFAGLSYWLYHAMNGQQNKFTEFIANYGYFAALVLGFAGGFHFIVPFPSIIFIPVFKQAGLNFFVVALLLAIGMTAAYAVEYFFAQEGWSKIHGHIIDKWTKKLHGWRRKHKLLPAAGLFLYSAFVPAPNELSLPIFAGLGYSALSVITIIFLGNFVCTLVYGSGLVKIFSR